MAEFIQRNKFVLLICILSIIPLYSLFNPTLLYTQDGYTHLVRGAAYFKAISQFNFPPRWAGDLNYGYGMPLFIFVFQLPYQLFALLIAFGFSLSVIFKILIFSSYLLSGLFMYYFARAFFDSDEKGFFVTILYQFFPFRFTDLLLRGSIGESLTFVFLPLLLLGILRITKKNSIVPVIMVSLSTFGLILSHIATGGIFILISILFVFFFIKRLSAKIISLTSILFGFLLSSYYLLPALIEHKYTFGDLFARNLYKENLVPLQKLFSLSVINDKGIHIGDVPVNLGFVYVVIVILIIITILYFKKFKKNEKRIIVFSSIVLFFSLIMISDFSKKIWESITLLRQFQFPWRFLAPAGFSISLFGGLLVSFSKNKKIFWLACTLIIFLSIPFWKPQLGYKKMDENYMWNYPMTTTYFGETDIIWSEGPAKKYPKQRVEIISGQGNLSMVKQLNNSITLKSLSNEELKLVAHVQFFPGWVVKVNGKKEQIQFQDANHRGEIVFDVVPGNNEIKLQFEEDKVRLFSDILTVLAFILLLPYSLFVKKFI